MRRPRETDFESMTREDLVLRLQMIRAQWRDRAARKRIRDAAKALAARQAGDTRRKAH